MIIDLQALHANTHCYFNSFLPSVIREWNELSQPIRNSTSLSFFKYKLNSGATNPTSYYFEGKRLGQIYHTRLRTSCSSLNQHLVSKNIVDSPLCACGSIEDTNHCSFNCVQYNDIRQQLINSISDFCDPTLNLLLYGDRNLTYEQNKNIMVSVQRVHHQVWTFSNSVTND